MKMMCATLIGWYAFLQLPASSFAPKIAAGRLVISQILDLRLFASAGFK